MSYSDICREYAAEAILRHERNYGEDADLWFAQWIVCKHQGAALARSAGELAGCEQTMSIADSALSIIREQEQRPAWGRGRCKRRVTDEMQYALAVALLERYESARGIGAAIWGLSDDEINNADI
jgi:hypothetical protein